MSNPLFKELSFEQVVKGCGLETSPNQLHEKPPVFRKPPNTPETYAWPLWKHLHDDHGLILTESEMHEILRHAAPFVPKSKTEAAPEPLADTLSIDELIAETQAQNIQLVEQNLRLINRSMTAETALAQAKTDIAELNTRLHTFNQDHLKTLSDLRAEHEKLKRRLEADITATTATATKS